MVRGWVDQIMNANAQECPIDIKHQSTNAIDGHPNGKPKVDIIGAGLAGTALALALHQASYNVRVWEARSSEAHQISSGVILTPNGLRCLDQLGVLARIRNRCWIATHRTYANDADEITKRTLIADEARYGYTNHRIWRKALLDEMNAMLGERGVPIGYNARLTSIDADDEKGVTFRVNGVQQHTELLIGADGIYSTIRRYITPIEPEYTGVIGILSHIKSSAVQWPSKDYLQCTFQGAGTPVFCIPEDPNAEEVMVGMQVQLPTFTRTDWERLGKDKDRMAELYRKGYEDRKGVARQLIDAVCDRKEELFLWPYMRMPKLERWYSGTGNVIVVGDAAHALPPSSGQGVNQALEDVYALMLALAKEKDRVETLKFWQVARQRRVDEIFEWVTSVQNVQRMSKEDRDRAAKEGGGKDLKGDKVEDMTWLYVWDIQEQIDEWARSLE